MQKTLLRQLKRSFNVGDEAELNTWLANMQTAAKADPSLRGLLDGFGDFIERVGSSYEQYERDLDLRTRSLEISSAELSGSNEKLRRELIEREGALASLRGVMRSLRANADSANVTDVFADDDIAALSRRIGELVAESEQGRRALIDQKFALDQHAIVSMTDSAGTIIYANDRFCEISGYSREALIGHNHRMIKSDVHPPVVFQDMWGTISLGGVWHGEICNRARDGHLYWVSATIVPLFGDDGRPAQYIGIRTDISDRKRMESELSEQLHLVEELIDVIPLPVYLKDCAGRYLRINRAFESFFGVQRESLIGLTVLDLLSPEDARLHTEKDAALLASRGAQTYEAVVHGRDGQRHDTIYRKAVLTQRDGRISGLLGTIIDITTRKQAEVEILKAKEAAESASRAKSDFLANMSHEIRTPMNGIIGMTELTLDTALTEEQRESLNIVQSSAESLLTIINDILDFSKIEAGKLQIEKISFNLHRVIAETLKTLALRAHEKNLELVSEVMPEVPRQVLGDPSRIRQVLLNLLGNAIKFTEKGEIAVCTQLISLPGGETGIHFSVSDTGIGIALDKQGLIFESFAQEDSSTTRRYGGTGLGLSISRRLVALMGGEMWLESQIDRGSTFHFSVKLAVDEQPPQAITEKIELRGRSLLIVDDNATNRHVLSRMLASWDIKVQDAESGDAALEIMRHAEQTFDCIILDAQMPEMDGYELAQRLRAEHSQLPPMLMLSSSAMRGDGQRCQDAGIAGFFAKPILADELLAALHRIFGGEETQSNTQQALINRHALRELQPQLDILLVEDHPINQKLALSLLEKWGHRATLVSNGLEALACLADRRFDLILMDIQMPVMGGVEATLRIRELEATKQLLRTPIIAMTAAAMQGDREACIEAGMDEYISKPIKARELLEKLLAFGGGISGHGRVVPAFDYGVALQTSDRETVEIIAGVFLDTWQRDIQRLREGAEQGDAALTERTAHSFKGALASFAAEPAVRVAADIEVRARNRRLTGISAEIDSLEREIEVLVPHLKIVAVSVSG